MQKRGEEAREELLHLLRDSRPQLHSLQIADCALSKVRQYAAEEDQIRNKRRDASRKSQENNRS